MCECGCADVSMEEAFRIEGQKTVVAYQVFDGCEDCDYGPAVAISFFDTAEAFPVEGVKIQTVHPNEFGSGREAGERKYRAGGFGFGLFDIEDLEYAAKALEESGAEMCEGSIADWLHDNGQHLVSEAMRRFRERTAPKPAKKAKVRR